ncbi:Piezo-type mechanosensitive ion channel like [Actinidia chinensis var. chinensis]|uniref:Piezo-type mechanosensitive ion channel like n=1 Tax=Actinidia chinensis var. chinensis TaxID=1590841 RepID=A0A2R6QL69_ACTCC|nr:Piezo-type mechanosensitive ion channel like [Actinidia chinensis var. chinensis]
MGRLLCQIVLPLLLLSAASLDWNLISLADLIASLVLQFTSQTIGFRCRSRIPILWCVIICSTLAVLSNTIFQIVLAVEGDQWSMVDARWAKLIGLISDHTLKSPSIIYFLVVQLVAVLVALYEMYDSRFELDFCRNFYSGILISLFEHIGSHLRGLCCLLLPAVQLVVGCSHPSWVSLPFFICSCVGLTDWSLTSNFLGLFRGWRYLLLYAGLNIVMLYAYQLPVEFSSMIQWIADLIGLYKISAKSEWSEICAGVSLLLFYFTLSCIRSDLVEMDIIVSVRESSLTEKFLPLKHSLLVDELRSGVRHTNVLLKGAVFRTFSINFFTYGLPISLFALSFWSFHFASLCAFGLLAYVGYILYTFPTVFQLHRLNCLLLVFILLWAASTYVFNVAFSILNKELQKDMDVWETIGLWHYPIPGLYIFAQFCLGILVAMGNLVNSSVFLYLSDGDLQSTKDNCTVEGNEEAEVSIVATIAWGLCKTSRAIVLALILSIALKPGFIHAIYMVFFMIYLLSHTISRRSRQALILLCEAHFALKYILQLSLICEALEHKGSLALEILSQLGLLDNASSGDFMKIAGVACFCAVYNHGSEMLLSFSTIVQHTPFPPIGWSILKAGLNKSVLLSVYTSSSRKSESTNSSQERRIAMYLNAIEQKFLLAYRSCGTYIVCLTILLTVYLVPPNYASFGYLFFLLLWITGRQLVEKTRRRIWFPLKLYALTMFVFIYCMSAFISFQTWLSRRIDLYPAFGFTPNASMFSNTWESLAVIIVMQLYSYERRQSKFVESGDFDSPEFNIFSFIKRLLIWHSEKILYVALLYASISPISAFGFLYLLGLVICSTLPKSSWLPSKLFMVYSAFLLMVDYLFQIWGEQAEMFPGQKNFYLSGILGLRLFKPGFLGLESGLRGKVLVIVACVLQYNVFYWLEKMSCINGEREKWEEPCALFGSANEGAKGISVCREGCKSSNVNLLFEKRKEGMRNSWPSFDAGISRHADHISADIGGLEDCDDGNYTYRSKDNYKWTKKSNHVLRKERLDKQKTTLKIYVKYWIENMFSLYGLEINMIVLLLASFAVLNAISLLYISSLAACVLIPRHIIKKLWPIFVFLFASIVTLEYLAIWLNLTYWKAQSPSEASISCHDCWKSSDLFFNYCKKCWLGIIVDDPRMLIRCYMVFMVACFKLRADHLSEFRPYQHMWYQDKKPSVLSDLSFETRSMWTFLDYLRHYSYCHLLDLVLSLILITGTLEYDILHLGYLGFALVFFRLRPEILKKKNEIFKFLRMYNFCLIVFSLAYQSPFIGDVNDGKCDSMDYIYEIIGFYKYDYGFRITSRSALVEIIIFVLVSVQSYMFSTEEFDYVSKYLEAEQIDALVCQQEKRAAWKTAQLQHVRKSEEKKCMRNLQVEKMKSEVLNLQLQLHTMTNNATYGNTSPGSEGCERRRNSSLSSFKESSILNKEENNFKKHDTHISSDILFPLDMNESPTSVGSGKLLDSMMNSTNSLYDIADYKDKATIFLDSGRRHKAKFDAKGNPLISAVHFIGDGVSQVQALGSQAVTNLVHFFNIKNEDVEFSDDSSENGTYYEVEDQNIGCEPLDQTFSVQSGIEQTTSDAACPKVGMILRYMWAQMRSNNDIVCYCSFVLMFIWNFSLLSMVYLAALFLYALCANAGPCYMFWVIMLIYTEICILLQYVYQITIQHCGVSLQVSFLEELGFPKNKIMSSFVISNLPLFLVYLFTLLQSSITATDGEWASVTEFSYLRRRNLNTEDSLHIFTYWERINKMLLPAKNVTERVIRSLYRFWQSLTREAETPPYFVQLSMEVNLWPDDGIQPQRIESGINKLLKTVHDMRCKDKSENITNSASRVRVQSIERSPENTNMALAVLEVVYASPLLDPVPVEWYKSLTPAADVAKEIQIAQCTGILKELSFPYPILSVIGGGKREVDLYAYVFCADLAVFFLVAIFYQSIIKNNSEFLEVYQLEDQFPKEFVFVLMIIFFLIVVDRVIYLCSFPTGKVIFYLFTLVLFTYSATKYAWYMEPSHKHGGQLALRAIYLTKAISLALQAIQIRYGVPHKSTLYRQFLTSSVSKVNFLGFRLYRALPFLYELRCVLDWSCTTTSLTMYDWLKLEDVHGSLFLVKCDVDLNRVRHQQGRKQTKMTKFCNGICLFLILMGVIWAPMLMYSSGNPTNIANPIKDASVQIDLKTMDGRLTLFETTLCKKVSLDELDAHIELDPQGYLTAYNEKDIQLICCQADATTSWLLPPIVQARFVQSLRWSMNIIFSWKFNRDRPKGKEVVKYELIVHDQDLPRSREVMEVLNGTAKSFRIYNVYPRYFRVTGSGDVRFLEQAVNLVSGDLVLNHGNPEWWSFHDINASEVSGCGELSGPMAVIVSEETPQGILGETLSKFSIWGLYITFVLAVGRFIRLQCSDLRMRIPFENLPSCDRLLAICEDIYAARAEGELEVEEVLYWILVKIYRSPHMLMEYTKGD